MMTSFVDVPEERLQAMRVRTLVMLADRDVVSVEHAARLARLVPSAELAVLPGSAHGTYLGVAEAAVPGSPLPDLAISMIEAFLGRGQGDLHHHDLEDLIAVIDARAELFSEINQAPEDVRDFVASQIGEWLDDERFVESLAGQFEGDPASQATRTRIDTARLGLRLRSMP